MSENTWAISSIAARRVFATNCGRGRYGGRPPYRPASRLLYISSCPPAQNISGERATWKILKRGSPLLALVRLAPHRNWSKLADSMLSQGRERRDSRALSLVQTVTPSSLRRTVLHHFNGLRTAYFSPDHHPTPDLWSKLNSKNSTKLIAKFKCFNSRSSRWPEEKNISRKFKVFNPRI